MSYPIDEADAAFYATLDDALLDKAFTKDSSAESVEKELVAVLQPFLDAASDAYGRFFIRRQVARTLRLVLSSWRLLAAPGDYDDGEIVDKFSYGYTASSAIRPMDQDPKHLMCQVKNCLTGEFKKYRELQAEALQSIIDGASKAFMQLHDQCKDVDADEKERVAKSLGAEPKIETATYSAILMHPPTPPKKRVPKRKREDQGVDVDETDVDTLLGAVEGAVQSPKTPKSNAKDDQTPSGKKRGGFNSEVVYVRWSKAEDYFIEQIARQEPTISWDDLVARVNDAFEGTAGVSAKGAAVAHRGPRSMLAVRKRFSKFKTEMARRKGKNEPTQGTDSDVEPEEEDERAPTGATVGEQGSGEMGAGAEAEVPENLFSAPNVAVDVDQMATGEQAVVDVSEEVDPARE